MMIRKTVRFVKLASYVLVVAVAAGVVFNIYLAVQS